MIFFIYYDIFNISKSKYKKFYYIIDSTKRKLNDTPKKIAFVKISCSDKFSICLNQLGVHHLEKD